MGAREWEFWIDVGGTFTDCLARDPDGAIHTHKLLSNGVYKGRVAEGSTREALRTDDRSDDPPGFFDGYRLSLAPGRSERDGRPVTGDIEAHVARFDPAQGLLKLDRPLPFDPEPGALYELSSGEEAPVVGIRWLLGKRLGEPIGPVAVRLGTTRGTNALLEKQGAPTAFVTTGGFLDVLRIANQNRPRLFDLNIRKPADLYRAVVELDERIDKDGVVLDPLDPDEARRLLEPLLDQGITSLAICLLNAYRNGAHEEIVARVAEELGFTQVSVSSRLTPLPRIVPRGDTTVVDAYLTPIIHDYVRGIRAKLPEASLKLMTSAGGVVEAETFVGKDSILSGPAGGVVGVANVSEAAGFGKAIGFDMGGTSTDVSRFDGQFERRYQMEVNDPESGAGVRIVAPMLSIETVAAGGGSICDFDGQKTIVGPRSAGSDPGPACYGRQGPLTVTDVNLYLGKILPEFFAFPLDRAAVEERLGALCDRIESATGQRYSATELADGFTKIANANMSAAIKKVSIARGYDVRDHVLVSFGGAGAQHACAIARELGIRSVLQHPYAGILSAYGIGMADVRRFAARDVGKTYSPESVAEIEPLFLEMQKRLRAEVVAEGIAPTRILPPRRLLDLRYHGQDSTITVDRPNDGDYAAEFERRHKRLYGFVFPGRGVQIHAARVEVVGAIDKPVSAPRTLVPREPTPMHRSKAYFDGEWHDSAVFRREPLQPGDAIEGPAIIIESISTVVVEPGWKAELTENDDLLLTDLQGSLRKLDLGTEVDAVTLELFNNQFASIAEQMGATLQKTSLSTNVKERLDFSCALFTPVGDLVVNAPHIPVHLGAMGETVKRLLADVPVMRPGDVFVTNDPYRGGSHLPDVTVITPVFEAAGAQVLFFTASRAHHADIGGITPGSMPPFSKSLAEEGVLIRTFRLVQGERSSEEELRRLLEDAPYPSRSVDENIADINAQVAANQTGVDLLGGLVSRYGLATVQAYMGHIQRAAENKMRRALLKIPAGRHEFSDSLDNGAVIAVRIDVRHDDDGGAATVDFTGTDPRLEGNLNANTAIVRSAVLYCFRCLIDEDIPLNDGVLAPVEIHVPEGCLLNPIPSDDPAQCPAVVGGNVETSQRVVDVVFGALGVVAASQGTMNNFLFGRAADGARPGFGYYETIGGGSGAGPGFAGASAVHSHMTNTRITDPEVMEDRYPVRVRRFGIRHGSGGAGQQRGGDGIVREIEFLEPLVISLLTNRRLTAPYGLAGGASGVKGANLLIRRDANAPEDLGSAAQIPTGAGDILRIETPGGGGYGKPA